MLSWFRHLRHHRWLKQSFPDSWRETLRREVRQATRVPADLQELWNQRIQVFVRRTTWEGCRGLVVTDDLKVVIAGYATLLTLGLEGEWLDAVRHVLIHPTPYDGRRASLDVAGLDFGNADWMRQWEDDQPDEHLGEAMLEDGTIVLAWSEVPTSDHITPVGQNVVIHEFAHGFHELRANWLATALTDSGERWLSAFQREFDRQVRDTDRGRRSLLDDYAAENPEEFFCVATECFLESPTRMQATHPVLYRLWSQCFRIDPASWKSDSPTSL